MISLVVPFINRAELTRHTLERAMDYSTYNVEIIALNDGASDGLSHIPLGFTGSVLTHGENKGVLGVFESGMKIAKGDIVVFTHNDLLIQERDWDKKVLAAFEMRPNLGMAGFVGARGVGGDGGRLYTFSNMKGYEWGSCECHEVVGQHHGEITDGFVWASTLDGCCTIFRKTAYQDVKDHTDAFDEHRPLNHWYDRNIPLHMIQQGWQVGVIGVGFDHYSANTGAGTENYHESVKKWAAKNNVSIPGAVDQASYDEGLRQFTEEWAPYLPVMADDSGNYTFTRNPIVN